MTTKQSVDILIFARWIIPVIPKGCVLENYAIAVNRHQILELLPEADAQQKYAPLKTYELKQHALMPGLINTHGHSAMTLFRGLADDLPLMEWLNNHIWPAEAKWVNEAFVADGTRLAVAEMLRSGTTCFSDMYFFPEVAAQQAEKCGIRAQFACPILDFPTIWGSGPDEYIDKTKKLAASYAGNPLVRIAFGPHAPYTVSDEPLGKIYQAATNLGLPVQIHLHETANEVADALSKDGKRPVQRLADAGFMERDIDLQCVHMTQIGDTDIELLQRGNNHVLHCPESNMKLASGFCPVEKLNQAGINVALGTDGAASNDDLDMLGEARTAALIGKAVADDASALKAHDVLAMMTINGARALGLSDVTGSLEAGKEADMIAINLDALHSQPLYNPASHIIYCAAQNQVSHVWIRGKIKLENHQLTELDEADLISTAKSWADKITTN